MVRVSQAQSLGDIMKLYESPSPNARRVHIFMAEKGLECDRISVDIRAAENLSAEYLAKNPGGRVPMLELTDGTCIGESVAICRYMESLQPESSLFGVTGVEAAKVEMWQRRAEINFFLEVAGAFRNITGFFNDRETCVAEWGQVCAERAPKMLSMFDEQLALTPYLAGDNFSIADITLAVALDFARMVKVVEVPNLPSIGRWYAEVSARSSFSAS